MKQAEFVARNELLWQRLEAWLDNRQLPRKERQRREQLRQQQMAAEAANDPQQAKISAAQAQHDDLDFPAEYRRLCHHLALAQSRMYSPLLIERLNQLVIRGHHQLYASRMQFWHRIAEFYLRTFPQTVRRESKVVALAALLFFGSLITMLIAIQIEPELIYSVADGEQVAQMEAMYDPTLRTRLGRIREADSDVLMFGHYIRNNTGIGFQSFAGGLLFGLGTLFYMLYNGIFIGALAGHLTHIGYIETFWGFVSGHSAFELTAIVLSGAAGFKLAEALLIPGRKTRRLALLDNTRIAIRIVYGAATLFLMAAFVEAFWSSQTVVPVSGKYATGLILWALLLFYLWRFGRDQSA
ncbi:MAG: stage II sporulation protein M [Thiolinea sp.]